MFAHEDRKPVPSAIPAERAEVISDIERASVMDRATQARIEVERRNRVERSLIDPWFWSDQVAADGNVRNLLPDIIARVMANFDAVCRSRDPIALEAMTTALAQLQSAGRSAAEDEYEKEAAR